MPVTRSTTKKLEDDEAEIVELNKEIQALKDEHDRLVKEHEALDDEHDRLEKEIEALDEVIAAQEDEIAAKEDEIAGLEEQRSLARHIMTEKDLECSEHLKAMTLVQAEMQKLRDYVSQECKRLAQKPQKRSSP